MKNAILMLTTSAVMFACGTIAASAQSNPEGPMSGGATTQQQQQNPQGAQQTFGQGATQGPQTGGQARDRDEERTGAPGNRGGMMGGMMGGQGRGMMGRDEGPGWHHGGWRRREGGGGGMMRGGIAARIIFSLMDSDGDGTVSLEEFRAAHDKIFKAMDANKDGVVTMQEMMDFMNGTARPASQP